MNDEARLDAVFNDVAVRLMRATMFVQMEHASTLREHLIAESESPIEELFAAAIAPAVIVFEGAENLEIEPQRQIGQYRVDFALTFSRRDKSESCRIVVECDGHDFHERTKEQAQRDKARDRWLTAQGWTVMRFTGSELHANPAACAMEVLKYGIENMPMLTMADVDAAIAADPIAEAF